MIPTPDRVLAGLADALTARVSPHVRNPYAQHDLRLAGVIALVLAQETDRLADRLQRENEAVAAILADALFLLDAPLAAAVHAALATPATDICVSTLQTRNDRLRALLVEVHSAVEAHPAPAARALDERIWDEYRESTRRRHVEYPL